nr:DUF3300 domain-containing protein [Pusillimonas sp. T7-7]
MLALLGQVTYAQDKLSNAQLDQLLAPVALYPDALLSQILMASTYPDDVAEAAKWSADHASLSGDAAAKATDGETWDPSVKSLAAFPSVLDMMGRQPQWVQSMGDAFLAQPDEVMASVQRLRLQAKQAGSLESNDKQKVTTETASNGTTVVNIEPASPQVVYVPSYNPTVVYGTWAYPSYPPYYYPPPPGSVFATALVSGIGFGLGVAAIDSLWGDFDWGHGDVDIDINRYNNINVNNRINHDNNKWQHNAANRGSTPYGNDAVRNRYDSQRQAGVRSKTTAPARDSARDRAAQSFQRSTGQPIAGHNKPAAGHNNLNQRPADGVRSTNQPAVSEHQRLDQDKARERARAANNNSALHGVSNNRQLHQQVQHRGSTAQSHVSRPSGGRMGGGAHRGMGRR